MSVEKVPCRECKCAAAEIRGDKLVIESRHHGRKHQNIFSIEWLIKKLEEASKDRDNISEG